MNFKPFFIMTTLALLTSGCMNSQADNTPQQPVDTTKTVSKNSAEDLFAQGLSSVKKEDYQTAAQLWAKSAELNHPIAQRNLGMLYEHGKGVEKDDLKAVYWYEKAAKQNDIAAQVKLGIFYQQGIGIRQDYQRAAEWYEKAAAQNDAQAQANLGFLYVNGYGVKKDLEKARLLWEKAAAQGNKESINNLQRLKQMQK